MSKKKKTQSGPQKGGNPRYPLSNLITCDACIDKPNGRIVGFKHSNGKNPKLVYEKYRCRACKRYTTRDIIHNEVVKRLRELKIDDDGLEGILHALNVVWKQQEAEMNKEEIRLQRRIEGLSKVVRQQVEEATKPENAEIKDDIITIITEKKAEIGKLKDTLEGLAEQNDQDKEEFLRFAFNFLDNLKSNFFELSPENRKRCKQIIFPAGFYWSLENKVYTPEISPLYYLATNKKNTSSYV